MKSKLSNFWVFSLTLVLCMGFTLITFPEIKAQSTNSNSDASLAACQEYKSSDRNICRDGFDTGYNKVKNDKNISLEAACGVKPGTLVADAKQLTYKGCEKGYNAGKTNAPTSPEGKTACEGANQKGSYLDDCIKGYVQATSGLAKDSSCKDGYSNSSGNLSKQACEKGYELGTASTKPTETKDKPDCDATGVVLSWIICPLIDLGTGLTDYVFQNIIRPLLESVPISTNPEDGTFKAWSSFRMIANILLVGTLLAIVYSQARGGGR